MSNTSISAASTTKRHGFTLVELLVVIVIIGLLATLAVPYLMQARNKARETQVVANLGDIHTALEQFGTDHNSMYPFRVRWFSGDAAPGTDFDPAEATDLAGEENHYHSDPNNWFSLGLFGGVRVVTDEFDDNTGTPATMPAGEWIGMAEHKVIQPFGWGEQFYERFNQYSDPLRAMGYIERYPVNPFLKRPMGNIMWAYGPDDSGRLNKTIPSPDVITTPGDFVYTHFYRTTQQGTAFQDPEGVVEAKVSYQASSDAEVAPGIYYLDLVDSYKLWAYGDLKLNGTAYIAYPNNSLNLAVRGGGKARRDYDSNGTRDMYEMGMITYFQRTGTGGSARDERGDQYEF
jgi:prepilin-type N-terminal cleavage/methylation domain-containing protein